jgi:hypothetical protein
MRDQRELRLTSAEEGTRERAGSVTPEENKPCFCGVRGNREGLTMVVTRIASLMIPLAFELGRKLITMSSARCWLM